MEKEKNTVQETQTVEKNNDTEYDILWENCSIKFNQQSDIIIKG